MRKRRIFVLLTIIFLISVVLTWLNVSIATAVETEIVSEYVESDLPLADPNATLWEQAISIDVPLSGQIAMPPKNPQASASSMRIRSLNNGSWVAFLLEWEDSTQDFGGGLLDFKDSAAIQFPSEEGEPFYCMGYSKGLVEILHWRSDFQLDITEGAPEAQNIYPNMWMNNYSVGDQATFLTGQGSGNIMSLASRITPVEDLVAGGAGTLTTQPHSDGVGWGEWDSGTWKAVIGRPMITIDVEDAQFVSGMSTSLAVAAWNGGNKEVNGKKAISTWLSLKINGPKGAASETAGGFGLPYNIVFTVSWLVVLVMGSAVATWVIARRK